MTDEVIVTLEFTPNPNTLKFVVNRELLKFGAANFTSAEAAKAKSPLGAKLFGVSGVGAIMIGRNFITITKTEGGDWDLVHEQSRKILQQHLESGETVVEQTALNTNTQGGGEVEQKIREILDNEIRPAVAMDGGDITFDKYEDGVVYLYMQGACAGCPSSTMTLKMGIENRLREAIPEIKEVVSI